MVSSCICTLKVLTLVDNTCDHTEFLIESASENECEVYMSPRMLIHMELDLRVRSWYQ